MKPNETEKLQIHLDEMMYGWLVINAIKGNKEIPMQFDEILSDALPMLVTLYGQIRDGIDFCYKMQNNIEIANDIRFEGHNRGENLFEFSVYGGVYDVPPPGWNENDIEDDEEDDDEEDYEIPMETFMDVFPREELLAMFRNFFDEILNYDGFPHQYPCWWLLVDEELNKVDDAIGERCSQIEEQYGEHAAYAFERRYIREHVHVRPDCMDFYLKYKKMLETLEVPEDWREKVH